jgi:hypothetical protein
MDGVFNINGMDFVSYEWIKPNLNLTSNRLKRWREGRGLDNNKLNYIKVNKGLYLYKKDDLIKLKNKLC